MQESRAVIKYSCGYRGLDKRGTCSEQNDMKVAACSGQRMAKEG